MERPRALHATRAPFLPELGNGNLEERNTSRFDFQDCLLCLKTFRTSIGCLASLFPLCGPIHQWPDVENLGSVKGKTCFFFLSGHACWSHSLFVELQKPASRPLFDKRSGSSLDCAVWGQKAPRTLVAARSTETEGQLARRAVCFLRLALSSRALTNSACSPWFGS